MRIRTNHIDSMRYNQDKAAPPLWRIWGRAFRLHYVLPSVLPALLGSAIARAENLSFSFFYFALVLTGVTINHLGINLIDDVMDYRNAVDLQKSGEKNFFTGGSGVLTDGLLEDKQLLKVAHVCFALTATIGVYLTYACGWPVLFLGLFGMACSIFYTAPPIRFGYRGFGELGLLINFGPVITLGAYYVQARTFAIEPLVASLTPGLMMWSMIIINEIPDYENDRLGGKWNLVARFGKKAGAVFCGLGLTAAYAVLPLGVWRQILSPLVLCGLLSIPIALKSLRIMKRHLNEPLAMAPANLAIIKVHGLTVLAMAFAYFIESFI